jgi:group I intron endonuclease
MTENSGIYKFTFPNGKLYVGQAINIKKRWQSHKNVINCTTHKLYKMPLYSAFRKYGWENVDKEVICECDIDRLDDEEIVCIKKYNTMHPNGYNLTSGGNGNKKMSSYTLEKMRIALIKRHKEKPMKNSSKNQISSSLKKYYRDVGEKIESKIKKSNSHRKYGHGLPRYINVRHFPTRTVYCIGKHPKLKYKQFNSLGECLRFLFMLDNADDFRKIKELISKVQENSNNIIKMYENMISITGMLEKLITELSNKFTLLLSDKQE